MATNTQVRQRPIRAPIPRQGLLEHDGVHGKYHVHDTRAGGLGEVTSTHLAVEPGRRKIFGAQINT